MPRYLIVGLLVAAVAALALAVGYGNITPSSFHPQGTVRTDTRPDFYIENARIQALDDTGKTTYELTASHAAHQIQDDSTRLSNPELLFYRGEDPAPWLLSAEDGLVTEKGDRVDLSNNVILEQNPETAAGRRLSTSTLTLFPARDYAETDQHVKIEAARSVTTAKGLQLFLNDGRLKLLSTVRGHYEVR